MSNATNRRRVQAAAIGLAALLLTAGCGGLNPQADGRAPAAAEAPLEGEAKPAAEAARGPVADAVKPIPGYRAANFTAVDVFTGEKVTLADLRGQVVFLNFWATWCGPCRVEMPEMEALQQEMGEQVRIVALGADAGESSEKLSAFATSMGLTFTIAHDKGKAMEAYRVAGIPTSFFIDREGVISARHTGPMKLKTMKQYIAEAEQGAKAKQ